MKEDAFSGLEAAIVVIAFVIVAAIFGMAVTSSGFFAAEKTKDVTTSGYKTASSAMYMEGAVYAYLDPGNQKLDQVYFSAGILETGQPQDLRKMIIVYTHSSSSGERTYYYPGVEVTEPYHFAVDGDPIMQPGDKRTFSLLNVGGPIPAGWFTIEIKPESGASTFITYHLSDSFTGGSVLS